MVTSLTLKTVEMDKLSMLAPELALRETALMLACLSRERAFLDAYIAPLLASVQGKDPYIARRLGGADSPYALEIFVWPAGAKTQIHDHSCWGALTCVAGALVEDRYNRLDDGSHLNQAHLRKAWRRKWRAAEGVSTLMPYEGGIHQVMNLSSRPVVSVHLYGPAGAIDGRDYDPLRDYVCDRLVSNELPGVLPQLEAIGV